jgi:hypothetical protein
MDVLEAAYGGLAVAVVLVVFYGVLTLVDTVGDRLYGKRSKRQR